MINARFRIVLALAVVSVPTTVQSNNIPLIGVLAPDFGTMRSVGRQIEVGVKVAAKTLAAENAALKVKFSIHRTIQELLKAEGLQAIIGGGTPNSARKLVEVTVSRKLPTVLLSNIGVTAKFNVPSTILQLGLPAAEAHRIHLENWINYNKFRKVSILYNAGHRLTAEYGTGTVETALHNLNTKPEYQKLIFSSSGRAEYKDKARTVKDYAPMGIVVSGLPWDTSNLVMAFAKINMKAPVYVAPPTDGVLELARIIHGTA